MDSPTQIPAHDADEAVRVSVIARDIRGFTHYYEDMVATPDAVRDAFNLTSRRTPHAYRVPVQPTVGHLPMWMKRENE